MKGGLIMKNKDIRIKALQNGVKMWQIANELGIAPETFSRRLRMEFTVSEKKAVMQAIESIANTEKGESPDV